MSAKKKDFIIKAWAFSSSANPLKKYQALLYASGKLSCDCPGWTQRNVRQCKHTRWIHLGLADEKAFSKIDYQAPIGAPIAAAIEPPIVAPKPRLQNAVRRIRY